MATRFAVDMRERRKVGLTLSSGVARGWAHIGAIRALTRMGVSFDIVAGCSAGALVGGCFLAQQLDELERWARGLSRRRMIGYLDLHLGRGGLIKGEAIISELQQLIGPRRIEELKVPFVAVATDLVTGHEIWLRRGDLAEAMRASFALPGVFQPMQVEGRWLADGALVDPLPVAVCRALGADMVIAVNLNTDIIGKSLRPTTNDRTAMGFDPMTIAEASLAASAEELPDSLTRGIFRSDGETPNFFGVLTTSLSIMQDRLTRSRLAGDPPDVHLTPRVGHIGLLEFDRANDAIREGERAVERKEEELADALRAAGRSLRP